MSNSTDNLLKRIDQQIADYEFCRPNSSDLLAECAERIEQLETELKAERHVCNALHDECHELDEQNNWLRRQVRELEHKAQAHLPDDGLINYPEYDAD